MTENKDYKKAISALSGFSTRKVTPIKAWQYGEALNTIIESQDFKESEKEYEYNDYLDLSNYLFQKHDIEITAETAYKYINIFKIFDYQLLEKNSSLEMKRHIEFLLNNYNRDNILNILKVLQCLEFQYNNASFEQYQLKTIYQELDTTYLFREIINNYDEKKVKNIAKNLLNSLIKKTYSNKCERYRQNKKQNRISNNRQSLGNIYIQSHNSFKIIINKLHKFAPIDEQGLIGLFFTLYSFLSDQKNNFIFSLDNQYYRFKSVRFLQTQYPDAELIVDIIEKNTGNEQGIKKLLVEFEYESKNFNTHGHIKEGRCDLIICWEDNWEENVIPILCFKNTLKEGKIVIKDI